MTRTNDRTKLFTILGLGSNLSNPIGQLGRAVDLLSRTVTVQRVSSVYITEPVGYSDQSDFFNLVLYGETASSVYGLHEVARGIEVEIGRTFAVRNGPRIIDIDLLVFGDLVLTSDNLTIPHPRMMKRTFVLEPLREVLPEWQHPLTRQTPENGLAMVEKPSRVERHGSLPGWGEADGSTE